MNKTFLFLVASMPFLLAAQSKKVTFSSLKELAEYAGKSGYTISMKPGKYALNDFLTPDSIAAKKARKDYAYINFSGNGNVFLLDGVQVEVDTEIRNALKPPTHTSEFYITGNNNTIQGLKITCINNGTSPGGALLSIHGSGTTLRNFEALVRGSFPYGYGDLFGKGGPDVIRHQKHSGVQITGNDTKLYNCKLVMRSFGHGFYMQFKAENIYFENCSVEGEVRSTDDVLKETSGPAFDVAFRTWTQNREGKYIVTPGYMKSLCEDAFRTYGPIKNVTFKNCTAKNTRAGFELRGSPGNRIENCQVIGVERGYWVGDGAIVENCKGDATYGPLLFVEGSGVKVELTVQPAITDRLVHALATIQGKDNYVVLKKGNGKSTKALPILVGYTHPEHGEAMSPYGEAPAENLSLKNETDMPVVVGEKAVNCSILSKGVVKENKGKDIAVKKL